jgi:hypothetical protein
MLSSQPKEWLNCCANSPQPHPSTACLLQFGKKLQAAMVRKLQEGDVTTQWSLTYKLNTRLRMQFNLNQFDKTIMFQYAS